MLMLGAVEIGFNYFNWLHLKRFPTHPLIPKRRLYCLASKSCVLTFGPRLNLHL
jgi:hypothetical protein